MRDQARTVTRGGTGASGASIIVHGLMLHLLIMMTIISLLKLAVRLVVIAGMSILVVSTFATFAAIAVIVLVAMMMVVPVTMIVGARTMLVMVMRPVALVTFVQAVGLGT